LQRYIEEWTIRPNRAGIRGMSAYIWPNDLRTVACSTIPMRIPGQTKCWGGPIIGPSNLGQSCSFKQMATYSQTERSFAYIRVIMLLDRDSMCWVNPPNDPLTAMQVLKTSSNWAPVRQMENGVAAAFVYSPKNLSTSANCQAFIRYGPRWQSGRVWVMRGYLCNLQAGAVADAEVDRLVASIWIQ